jgi:hypothetical protein
VFLATIEDKLLQRGPLCSILRPHRTPRRAPKRTLSPGTRQSNTAYLWASRSYHIHSFRSAASRLVLIFCKNIVKPNTACIQKSLVFLQNTPLVMFLMLPFVHNKDVKEQTLFLTNQKNSYVGAFIPARIHSRIPSILVWSNFC